MANSDSLQLDSFEVHLADISTVPVNDLQALSMGVNWPHRPNDWRAVLALGQGVVARDTIGRVLGSAMWFPMGPRFATFGMVVTSPRLQSLGAGRRMMAVGQEALGKRDIGLNATRQAKRLYLSLGFVPEKTVFQHQGQVRCANVKSGLDPLGGGNSLRDGDCLRDIVWDDLDAVGDLDARAYGADRPHVLRLLMAEGAGIALEREGRLVAYSFVRRFGRGHVVGPIVAANDADAIAVTAPPLLNLDGAFARIDTRQDGGAFSAFLLEAGLGVYDTVTTMSLGRPWVLSCPGSPARDGAEVYGLMTQAVG